MNRGYSSVFHSNIPVYVRCGVHSEYPRILLSHDHVFKARIFLNILEYFSLRAKGIYKSSTKKNISAVEFSNVILPCSALSEAGCLFGPALTRHHGNRTLQNNAKYVIKEQPKDECRHR